MIKPAISLIFITICYGAIFEKAAEGPEADIAIGPIGVLIASTIVAILGGLGHLLKIRNRADQQVTRLDVLSHFLNMGTIGAGSSMLLYGGMMYGNGHSYPSETGCWIIVGIIAIVSTLGLPFAESFAEFVSGLIKRFARSASEKAEGDAKD